MSIHGFTTISSTNQSSYPVDFIPVKIDNLTNFTVSLEFDNSSLINNNESFYLVVVYGVTSDNTFNAVVIINIFANQTIIDFAFASDISANPLTFTRGNSNMIDISDTSIVLVFSEYGITGKSPDVVSAISLFSLDNLTQFETDFNNNFNLQYNQYLTMNSWTSTLETSQSITTDISKNSTITSSHTKIPFSISLTDLPLMVFLSFITIYFWRRNKKRN